MMLPSDARISSLRGDLLDWFDTHKRDLPWRRTSDPYAIWISEIMLQQTQVITVKDYYTRWMATFPDVDALAAADLDDVLKLWAGLGYYRRARSLHAAAQKIVQDFDSALPQTIKQLKSLPGIGDYTAGAVASIAHGLVAPLVDGNVERVFARQFAIPGDPKDRTNQKHFWAIATALVDPARPGDFNQSLMELGATMCTPKKPACLLCPVREDCAGLATGDPLQFPAKVKRKKAKPVQIDSLILCTRAPDPLVVLVKRPNTGLLPGLLEAPSSPPIARQASQEGAAARLAETLSALNLPVSSIDLQRQERLGEAEHVFSHLKMRMHVHVLSFDALPEPLLLAIEHSDVLQVAPLSELSELAVSAAQHKVFAMLKGQASG